MPRSKGIVVGFWIVTALFCLQIGVTAYFRVELSWAKAPRRGAAACAGAGAAQGVGLRRLRHRPRLCAHRPPLGGRWPGGVGLGGGHRRALGALVLLLAPPAGHAGERLTAHRRLLKS